MVSVQLEREDEEEVSPYVMAPFFPQVSWIYVPWIYVSYFLLSHRDVRKVGGW